MSNPVPEGWKVTPLENILYRPLAYGVLKPGENVKNGVPVVRIQDIRGNRLNFDGLYRISSELHREFRRTKLNEGDLIISLVGTIGKTFVVPASLQDANVTRAFGVIGVQEAVSPEYVTQWLNSDSSQQWIQDQSQGNAQKVLNLGALKQFPLQLPPLPEQQKIAAILSSVDNVIEKTRAQIDKLKDLKIGMMQELLTKGIGHPEYKESPIGKIPVSWQTGSVINYAQVSTGNKDTKDRVEDGRYPFFVRSQKVEKINSYSFDGEAVLTAGDGVGTGKVFHYINGRFDVHQRVYKISNFSDQLDGRFFFYFFSKNFILQVNRLSAKGSVDSVRREMITEMQIPLPAIAEQIKIAGAIKAVDERISATSERLRSLEKTKKALMQDLLTGKVRVNVDQKESAVA